MTSAQFNLLRHAVLRRVRRGRKISGEFWARQCLLREVSNAMADELRKRGVLKPENEGYHPDSWAKP